MTALRVGDVVEVSVRAVAAGGGRRRRPTRRSGRIRPAHHAWGSSAGAGERHQAQLGEGDAGRGAGAWPRPSAAPVPVIRSLRRLHAGAFGLPGAAALEGAHGGRRVEAYRPGHGGPAGGRLVAVWHEGGDGPPVGTVTGRTVVDAYCGVGVYGRVLARTGARVAGIEIDPAAAAAAREDAPAGFRVIEGAVEDHLGEVLPADVVILNPPRAGVDDAVTRALSHRRIVRIIYVSCDPATLARDVGRLKGYRLTRIEAFDLFPQTAHVETLALLECD